MHEHHSLSRGLSEPLCFAPSPPHGVTPLRVALEYFDTAENELSAVGFYKSGDSDALVMNKVSAIMCHHSQQPFLLLATSNQSEVHVDVSICK